MRTTTFLALMVAACVDDATPTAVDACRTYLDVVCTRGVSCGEASDKGECVQAAEARLPGAGGCDATVGLRDAAAFESCIAQLRAASCDELAAGLPPECADQLLY